MILHSNVFYQAMAHLNNNAVVRILCDFFLGGSTMFAEWRPTLHDECWEDSDSACASQSGYPAVPWWNALPHTHRETDKDNSKEDKSEDPENASVNSVVRVREAVWSAIHYRLLLGRVTQLKKKKKKLDCLCQINLSTSPNSHSLAEFWERIQVNTD